jgi:hypothetical protein
MKADQNWIANSDGVNLYNKRADDACFPLVTRNTTAPYLDNRPLKVPANPTSANGKPSSF